MSWSSSPQVSAGGEPDSKPMRSPTAMARSSTSRTTWTPPCLNGSSAVVASAGICRWLGGGGFAVRAGSPPSPYPVVSKTMGADGTAPGDKPARRIRNATTPASAQDPAVQLAVPGVRRTAEIPRHAGCVHERAGTGGTTLEARFRIGTTRPGTDTAVSAHRGDRGDADLASDLIASGATTQSVDTVIEVLSSHAVRRIDKRRRQRIRDQLPDCAADRGGCRRASAGTARGGSR